MGVRIVVLLLAVDGVCLVETNAAWGVISYSGVGMVFLLLGLVSGRQTWRLRSIWKRSMIVMWRLPALRGLKAYSLRADGGLRVCVKTQLLRIQPRRGDLNLAQDAVRRTESWVGRSGMNSPVGTAETRWNDPAVPAGLALILFT